MQVAVRVYVEVDEAGYSSTYGVPATESEIADDVAERVRGAAERVFEPFDWAKVSLDGVGSGMTRPMRALVR